MSGHYVSSAIVAARRCECDLSSSLPEHSMITQQTACGWLLRADELGPKIYLLVLTYVYAYLLYPLDNASTICDFRAEKLYDFQVGDCVC